MGKKSDFHVDLSGPGTVEFTEEDRLPGPEHQTALFHDHGDGASHHGGLDIAATSTDLALDDVVESRFGRCAFFFVIDTETLDVEPIRNPNISMGGGAGIQSAQLLANKEGATAQAGLKPRQVHKEERSKR